MLCTIAGRQIGNPRPSLGLAVHDIETLAMAIRPLSKIKRPVSRQLSARLGQVSEVRILALQKAANLKQVIGVGNAGDAGDMFALDCFPELRLRHRALTEHERMSKKQMRMQDRKPERIMSRKGCNGALARPQFKVFCNCQCVAPQVLVRKPHQLLAARRSGC